MDRAFKGRKDAFAELANHIRQHIQAPAMGHAQRYLFNAARGRAFDQLIEQGE